MAPLVAVAAERLEFTGLLRRLSALKTLDWPLDFAVEGKVDGQCWLLLANGPGPRLASEAVRAALSTRNPRAVISTGFCGALAHFLKRGDILIASEIHDFATGKRYPAAQPYCPPGPAVASILSLDRVAVTVRQKRELAALGASAVEMESGAVAPAALDRNIPFYCIRVVSDSASDTLPFDFNRFRDQSGRFNRGRIAAECILRPGAVPRLMELSRVCRSAAETLGEFLVNCKF